MAHSKRRRAESEDEDEDEDQSDIELVSSSRTKRVRPSYLSPSPNGEGMDDLNGVYTFTHTANDDATMDDIEIFSEEEDEEEDGNAEVDEVRASKYIAETLRRNIENMPSESGIIEEVSMRNFMCHGRLTIPLGPLINFIIGHNGSGKSAILTAITICLGAKASVTNRAGSLKNFIKEGQDAAWVAVKLKNQGENAYQPEIYGRSIIVERHFTRSGTSNFKIKNDQGKLVSAKRADLEDITDFFALQIENPMNVLSQDMARQFLSNSTPHDKYKFFIKGTQLEQLDKDYKLMEEGLDNAEIKCEAREEDVAILGEKKRKAEDKKNLIDRMEGISTQIAETGWMFAWAQIEEQERVLEERDQGIHALDEKIESQQRKVDHVSQIYEEEHQNHGANMEVIEDLKTQLGEKKEIHAETKTRFQDNRALLESSKSTQRQIRTDMDHHRGNIEKIQDKINAENTRIDNANGPFAARKVAELDQLKADVPTHQHNLEVHRQNRPRLEHNLQRAKDELQNANLPLAQHRADLQQAENLLSSLQKEQPDQMRAFGPHIHRLVKAIQNDNRFQTKPVGPMGFHVRLKKPEWASIIEVTLGNALDTFIVTTKSDQRILSELMGRLGSNSPILIGAARPIDTARNEPEAGVDTILRVLEIDNDLVRNQLIINNRIEQTILIPERAAANAYNQQRKPNTFAVQCHHETQRGRGWRFEISRGGNEKMSPIQPWSRAIRMKTSAEEQIRLATDSVYQAKQSINQDESLIREKQEAVKTANQAIIKHDRDLTRLREALQRIEDQVQGLEAEITEDNVQDTGVLEELRRQLEEAQRELEMSQNSFKDSVNEKDRIDEINREVKRQADAALAEVNEAEAKIRKAEERAEQRATRREKALYEKNLEMGRLATMKVERQESVDQRDSLAQQLEQDLIPQAEEVHPRVPVPRGMTTDQLDKKLDSLIKERERFQQRVGGDRDKIYEAWSNARKAFAKANNELAELQRIVTKTKRTLMNRRGRWRYFRKYITMRARITFMYLLSERGFRGRLLASHLQKMLDINVEPDTTRASDRGRQANTLSGGEKSFSTICLLLSIWEAMGSPIRCLDEFDVFMDHANREVSMKMMVQAARRSVGRQFILITPQAMTAVEGWHDVRIFKMSDPERGQTNLPFEQ